MQGKGLLHLLENARGRSGRRSQVLGLCSASHVRFCPCPFWAGRSRSHCSLNPLELPQHWASHGPCSGTVEGPFSCLEGACCPEQSPS